MLLGQVHRIGASLTHHELLTMSSSNYGGGGVQVCVEMDRILCLKIYEKGTIKSILISVGISC
jgi:hypothetical protein